MTIRPLCTQMCLAHVAVTLCMLSEMVLTHVLRVQVDLWTYVWASAVGIVPMGFVCVYVGTCAISIMTLNARP